MMSNNTGKKICIALGLLLITAALILTAYNQLIQVQAGKASESIKEKMTLNEETGAETAPAVSEPEEPEMPTELEMTTESIDGYDYIGILEIPSLGLTLPVMADWDYTRLNIAPCRYSGSLYGNDMVICAHNYDIHFGQIKTLLPGDTVIFTDIEGRSFRYLVSETETLQPEAIDEMISGDWDLTLFTCTIGGMTRVTVRCVQAIG